MLALRSAVNKGVRKERRMATVAKSNAFDSLKPKLQDLKALETIGGVLDHDQVPFNWGEERKHQINKRT
jgi:hypothetical protein